MTASLASLLSDIERATEGSRALDCQIEVAHGLPDFQLPTLNAGWEWALEADEYRVSLIIRGPKFSKVYKQYNPPSYTRSLDAAMTLVPDDWTQGHLSWPGYDNGTYVNRARAEIDSQFSSGGGPRAIAFAATLALALCAACLRARMATTQNEKPPNPHEGSPAA